jgi:hypothetical protein
MSKIQAFDFSTDLLKALLWQYNDAQNLQGLIQSQQDWMTANHKGFWENWYRDVFNLQTANSFGLQVWSIILDVPIVVIARAPQEPDIPFGFDEDDGNFENSNFAALPYEVRQLTTEQARLVLKLRYAKLVSDGTVVHTNEILSRLFDDREGAYVIDNHDMTISYVFAQEIPSKIRFIFQNYDILPRPSAVKINNISVISIIPFGFDQDNNNFDQGSFYE